MHAIVRLLIVSLSGLVACFLFFSWVVIVVQVAARLYFSPITWNGHYVDGNELVTIIVLVRVLTYRIFLRLRFKRRTRFFLHFSRIFGFSIWKRKDFHRLALTFVDRIMNREIIVERGFQVLSQWIAPYLPQDSIFQMTLLNRHQYFVWNRILYKSACVDYSHERFQTYTKSVRKLKVRFTLIKPFIFKILRCFQTVCT